MTSTVTDSSVTQHDFVTHCNRRIHDIYEEGERIERITEHFVSSDETDCPVLNMSRKYESRSVESSSNFFSKRTRRSNRNRILNPMTSSSTSVLLSVCISFLSMISLSFGQVNTCGCSPAVFYITFDFSRTCLDNNLDVGPGTGLSQQYCTIAVDPVPGLSNPTLDLVPIEINAVKIFELDLALNVQFQTIDFVSLKDGATYEYVSYLNSTVIPGGVQMEFNAINQENIAISLQYILAYTNLCDAVPFIPGSSIGWAVISDVVEPGEDTCRLFTGEPTVSFNPTTSSFPTVLPSAKRSESPSFSPSISSSVVPTTSPSVEPTVVPSISSSSRPTGSPTKNPTVSPTSSPSTEPTNSPTKSPTVSLTDSPSANPTSSPTVSSTVSPTVSELPTAAPVTGPTNIPTPSPIETPTDIPSSVPTSRPTSSPTMPPVGLPSFAPTVGPTESSSVIPSSSPSTVPTGDPSSPPVASETPSLKPSSRPTPKLTEEPTPKLTEEPTQKPTEDEAETFPPSSMSMSFSYDSFNAGTSNFLMDIYDANEAKTHVHVQRSHRSKVLKRKAPKINSKKQSKSKKGKKRRSLLT